MIFLFKESSQTRPKLIKVETGNEMKVKRTSSVKMQLKRENANATIADGKVFLSDETPSSDSLWMDFFRATHKHYCSLTFRYISPLKLPRSDILTQTNENNQNHHEPEKRLKWRLFPLPFVIFKVYPHILECQSTGTKHTETSKMSQEILCNCWKPIFIKISNASISHNSLSHRGLVETSEKENILIALFRFGDE